MPELHYTSRRESPIHFGLFFFNPTSSTQGKNTSFFSIKSNQDSKNTNSAEEDTYKARNRSFRRLSFAVMALRFDSRDATAFKFLFFLAAVYGVMSILAYYAIHSKFVKPLDFDAPLDRFSEARAVEHVRVLSQEIDGRQVSLL